MRRETFLTRKSLEIVKRLLRKKRIRKIAEALEAPFTTDEIFLDHAFRNRSDEERGHFREGLAGAHLPQIEGREALLPNAFIIGAAKSGTTSLTHSFSHHPDVCVSKPKEPKFLSVAYHQGWDWYLGLFKRGRKRAIRMEGSTRYTSGQGVNRAVPVMLKTYMPQARLIFICRHPMERLVSHWRHYMGTHPDRTDGFEALLDDVQLATYIVGSSMFWTQLQSYRAHFPDSQILCLTFEDMIADPEGMAARLLGFLGLPADAGGVACLLDEQGRFARKNEAGAGERKPVPRPDWPPEMEAVIRDWIAPDAAQFLAHIGKPADYWAGLQGG
jgi:hypothetical protein